MNLTFYKHSPELNNHAVQIATTGQLVKFTKGQKGLLDCLKLCVELKEPLSWDIIVGCYYSNVRKSFEDYRYIGEQGNREREYFNYDVLECYKKQDVRWTYTVRPKIRSWVVSTIGILVLKNQLIVLPVINIEE